MTAMTRNCPPIDDETGADVPIYWRAGRKRVKGLGFLLSFPGRAKVGGPRPGKGGLRLGEVRNSRGFVGGTAESASNVPFSACTTQLR